MGQPWLKNNRDSYRKYWWRFAEARPSLRLALDKLPRFIATVAHSKHRFFVWLPVTTSPDQALITVTRADDTTFGILHSRFHELWSLRMGTSLEDRPRYTPTTCFETFPFPPGLSPADTAHQRTEALPSGATIPADLPGDATATTTTTVTATTTSSTAAATRATSENFKTNRPLALYAQAKAAINTEKVTERLRHHATAIAQAAKRLNDLREAWLNPPEWTHRVPEVVPLGLSISPYPDRVVAQPGFEKELAKRTLTHLYNQRPAWLAQAHAALDAAVAAAYGWADHTAAMPDEEVLTRLLALNLARHAAYHQPLP